MTWARAAQGTCRLRPAVLLIRWSRIPTERSIIDGAFPRRFGIGPSIGITIRAAVNNLWQALNDTPASIPTTCQLQHWCLLLTAHQFLHHVIRVPE